MALNFVQTALDVLESIRCQFPEWESSKLEELKAKLRLLRTFYMCGKKWGKDVRCRSTLLGIEDVVHKHSEEIKSVSLRLRDEDKQVTSNMKWDHLQKGVSDFLVGIQQSLCQEIKELYPIFSNVLLQTSSSSREVELVDIMDSLLHNLQDLLQHKNFGRFYPDAIEDLENNVRFLKNFILFATFRGLEHRQMEDLLTHIEGLIASAAQLPFMSWYDNRYEMQCDIHQLINTMKPFQSHVCGIYVGVFQASKLARGLSLSSHHLSPGSHRLMLGDFVDSLLVLLWPRLFYRCYDMDFYNHQMQKLYEELIFLRTILRDHQNKFAELYEKMRDIIGVVICEAGIIFCYHFVKENKRELVEKLELQLSDLDEKFKLIKAAEKTQKYQLMSASYYPQTNLPGFIDSVLEKMKLVNPYEADSVSLAEDKFQVVHDDLAFLRSFSADAMVQSDQNGKLQILRSRIVVIAYEIEFVLDSLAVGDALQNLVMLLNIITEEIKLIKAEASVNFCNNRQISIVHNITKAYSKMPSTRKIPISDEPMIGLRYEAQKIIDRLNRGTEQLDIVSIVGMAGLGKTTLAKQVYSDPSIIHHFHVRSWCSVSQVFKRKSLLLEILCGFDNASGNEHREKNEDDLAEMLYKHLKRKRYLIVLDDVWDTEVWNSLRSSFPNDTNGSRILLTSRHHHVASQIKPDSEPHSLRSLTDDESWELLQKKTCYKESCPPALLESGKEIAQHCKGLPLMILIVAGILSNVEQDTWKEVAKSLRKSTLPITEQCMKTLELSYFHLPDHLKPCFLYFGAYEEDQQVSVRELLWLWMAEGFVEKNEGKCLEDVAECYMMELIQRNLVMVAKRGTSGRVKSCILHDLLLDFCKSKVNEEHFLHCLYGYQVGTFIEPNIIYRLHVDSRRVEDFEESRMLYPHLRTLFLNANHDKRHGYDMLYKFCQSKLLRVLDVRRIDVGHFFPRVIESLVHLRYLALVVEGMTLIIPSSIENLSNLETFILKKDLLDVSMPDSVWNMKKLRHLGVIGSVSDLKLPEENLECHSNLENLEALLAVYFSCGQKMKKVMRKFPNIRRLKCILNTKEACTRNCKILTLDFMSQLESLTIIQREEKFHGLHFQFPQNLKKLGLSGFCLPWSKISAIDELPNLEVLKLLDNAFTGENWDMGEGKFPKLRFLKLAGLDLARWTDSDDSFPCLEKLVLKGCRHLEEVPSSLSYISTLQAIEVNDCVSVESSIKQIQEVQMDMGNEDLKILIQTSIWTNILKEIDFQWVGDKICDMFTSLWGMT